MASGQWRGSFAIPMTPFDERDRIDVDVLAEEVEFCIACGVGGIATPLMVSEFRLLSEEERKLMIRVPVEVSAGRVPVIANVAAVNLPLAVSYATYAPLHYPPRLRDHVRLLQGDLGRGLCSGVDPERQRRAALSRSVGQAL